MVEEMKRKTQNIELISRFDPSRPNPGQREKN